jgi:integrase/recombinase XerD
LGFAEATIGEAPTAIAMTDLDAKLILAFLDHLEKDRKNTVRSRNARLAALRSFLKYAAHHDFTALAVIEQALSIPMKRFEKPLLGFLTRQEMRAILEAPDATTWAGRRDRALFNVMYNIGARVSEAIGLRIQDIVTTDGSAAVHLLGKGRKHRSVPLWKPTTLLLRDWVKRLSDSRPEAFLFPNRNGGQLTRSNVAQRLDLAVISATESQSGNVGRSVSPHTIRHTTAMHMLQSGVDITVIALWFGHESPATTRMYLEADLSMKERALTRLQPIEITNTRYRPPD